MSLVIDPVNNPSLSAVTLTSPRERQWRDGRGTPIVQVRGYLAGTSIRTTRNQLNDIAKDHDVVTVTYSDDPTFNGSYFLDAVEVTTESPLIGEYRLTLREAS